jgi:hypothetical protein
LAVAPIALIAVAIRVLDGPVAVFFVVEPLAFVLAACLVVVNTFSVLFTV